MWQQCDNQSTTTMKFGSGKGSDDKNDSAASQIFMPIIYEINCATKLIHDYHADKGANEPFGITYSIISNQFLENTPLSKALTDLPKLELISDDQ